MYYISSTYIFHQIFILSKILPNFCSEVQNLATPKVWTFCPQKLNHALLTHSWLVNYPWPIQIQKHPEDLSLKFISTMKLLYTYFWLTLPPGDLFGSDCWGRFLRPSTATFNSATSSNHLKTYPKCLNLPFEFLALKITKRPLKYTSVAKRPDPQCVRQNCRIVRWRRWSSLRFLFAARCKSISKVAHCAWPTGEKNRS